MAENIPLLKVNQWLSSWSNKANLTELGEPPKYFYIASMSLAQLRVLSGVHQRTKEVRKKTSKEAGFQRELDTSRTRTIARYIQYGYPVSSDPKLIVNDSNGKLIHPGWLPTPFLINVLVKDDERWIGSERVKIKEQNLLSICKGDNGDDSLIIPDNFELTADLSEVEVKPIEIIDGQHRVFAIDEIENFSPDYQVPVVIFVGLSQSWQAYLFWVINVEPKRINPSLAYDLYPELRSEEWLENKEGGRIYRDHRAQELTDIMWRHPDSPWRDRIELFGNRVEGHVSNAAFIRSLASSFLKNAINKKNLGGLFSSIVLPRGRYVVSWKRAQQAAFLIQCWNKIKICASKISEDDAAKYQRGDSTNNKKEVEGRDLPALLASPVSLLATDQGVNAIHNIFNIFCIKKWEDLDFSSWQIKEYAAAPDEFNIELALKDLEENEKIDVFLTELADSLVNLFDWRTSGALNLTEDERKQKAAYRGGSGYTLLKNDVIAHLKDSQYKSVSQVAIDLELSN